MDSSRRSEPQHFKGITSVLPVNRGQSRSLRRSRLPVADRSMPIWITSRLPTMREDKHFSQGDIEKKTGLPRCYICRVEKGHTVPAIETLEKMARALEVPMYQLFYKGEEPPKLPNLLKRKSADDILWGNSGKDQRTLVKFCRVVGRMKEDDRAVFFLVARKMAR